MLRAAGLSDLFEGCVKITKDTRGLQQQKPHLEPYRMAAEKLGVPINKCTVFEDSDAALENLRKAGVDVVDVRVLPGYPSYDPDVSTASKL
mmetsp:Transcript_7311/g.18539  ORF Transcript_7311/g.18539 Transcript_7311/m.18539 type:complete len:91 (+) Transcript_7311:3-275(+)